LSEGDLIGGRGGQVGQRVEGSRLRILGEGVVKRLHRPFPAANALPVVRGCRVGEECLCGGHESALTLGGRIQGPGLLYGFPATLTLIGSGAGRPHRLEERHRDPPVGHRALRIDFGHPLECTSCLRVRHVVK